MDRAGSLRSSAKFNGMPCRALPDYSSGFGRCCAGVVDPKLNAMRIHGSDRRPITGTCFVRVRQRLGAWRRVAAFLAVLALLQTLIAPALQACGAPNRDAGAGVRYGLHTVTAHQDGHHPTDRGTVCAGASESGPDHSCAGICNAMTACSPAMIAAANASSAPPWQPNDASGHRAHALTRSVTPDHPPPRA